MNMNNLRGNIGVYVAIILIFLALIIGISIMVQTLKVPDNTGTFLLALL